MKKIVSSVLVCVLLLSTVFVLASCAKQLNGEYEGTVATFEFKGEEVSVEIAGVSVDGTYTIEEDKIIFDFESPVAKLFNGEHSFSEGNDGDTKFIKIDGVQYNKK